MGWGGIRSGVLTVMFYTHAGTVIGTALSSSIFVRKGWDGTGWDRDGRNYNIHASLETQARQQPQLFHHHLLLGRRSETGAMAKRALGSAT